MWGEMISPLEGWNIALSLFLFFLGLLGNTQLPEIPLQGADHLLASLVSHSLRC
jgi:hypothetical protein